MILSFLLSLLFTVASAQSTDASILNTYPDIIQEKVNVTIDPQNPAPRTPATITLDSYGNNLDAASIKWTINGKVVQTGTGDKVLKVVTGNAGQVSNIVLNIIPNDGPPFSQSITLIPESLDLIWSSDGYTPPLYKGKALYPSQGAATFIAMPEFVAPDGTSIPAKDLIYNWTRDNTALADQSGYGKNTFTITGDAISSPTVVQVDVQSQDGRFQASKAIELDTSDTQALVYQSNPLYGVLFNKAVPQNFNLSDKEVTFEVYPYFFSIINRTDPRIGYNWSMNSASVNVPSAQDNLTFRNTNDSSGNSAVSVNISTSDKILQAASQNFNLSFGQAVKNLFGI